MLRAVSILTLVLTACGGAPAPLEPTPIAKTRFDLRTALGVDDAEVVGVAYRDGIYVLDDNLGLYRLEADGSATSISNKSILSQTPVQPPFTDLASIGDGRFAITAINDGFVLDPELQTFRSHFCYEPGWLGDRFAPTPVMQVTNAVAVDPAAGLIYAQPQTLDETNSEVLLSQVGVWDLASGAEMEWYDLADVDFLAGGMVVESHRVLLLGRGDELHRYTIDEGKMELLYDLSANGISDLRGLAQGDGKLFVVDGEDDELVIIAR